MPRNANGIYSLPEAPFQPQTVIQSASVNSDLSDIGTALTQSLATTGVSTMTGPIVGWAGSVTTPSYTFASDLDTGFYQVSPGIIGAAANSINAVQFNATSGLDVVLGASFSGLLYSFTTSAIAAFLAAMAQQFTITITIDGGGSVPSTGMGKAYYLVPCPCTVTQWSIFADQSGSAVVDVDLSTYAGFPPTVSIAGTDKPTLSAVQKNQSSALTGWTTTLPKGNVLGFDLDSVTTCTRIIVTLLCTRTGR